MNYYYLITAFLLALFMTLGILPEIIQMAYKKGLFDVPENRKVHTVAVPRLGGLSFTPIIALTLMCMFALNNILGNTLFNDLDSHRIFHEFGFLLGGLALLYVLGLQDDLGGINYKEKFAIQFLAAFSLPVSGVWINNLHGLFGFYLISPFIGIPLTAVLVVFIINSINLIDGIDGLASSLSGLSLFLLGTLFLQNGALHLALLAFASLGVLIPFFYYNVFGKAEKKSKTFMGDTGSMTLGYILAFLVIHFIIKNPGHLLYPEKDIVLASSVLVVPCFDAISVMLIRAKERKGLFKADKNHIHHKLLRLGFTPRQVLIQIFLMALLFILCNYLFIQYFNITIVYLFDIVLWMGLNFILNKQSVKHTRMLMDNEVTKNLSPVYRKITT